MAETRYTYETGKTAGFAKIFNRTANVPLERSQLFDSLEDAQNYAKADNSDYRKLGTTSYVGQLLTVYQPAGNGSSEILKVYVVNSNKGLTEVGRETDLSGYVPTDRTINGKSLNSNISLTKEDIGLNNVSNIAPSDYFTSLTTDSTKAITIIVGGTEKSITTNDLKTSLGLKGLAYKDSISFDDLNDHPTTLAKYGITDAKIENTTITLGSNSVDLSNYLLKNDITPSIQYSEETDNTGLFITVGGVSSEKIKIKTSAISDFSVESTKVVNTILDNQTTEFIDENNLVTIEEAEDSTISNKKYIIDTSALKPNYSSLGTITLYSGTFEALEHRENVVDYNIVPKDLNNMSRIFIPQYEFSGAENHFIISINTEGLQKVYVTVNGFEFPMLTTETPNFLYTESPLVLDSNGKHILNNIEVILIY